VKAENNVEGEDADGQGGLGRGAAGSGRGRGNRFRGGGREDWGMRNQDVSTGDLFVCSLAFLKILLCLDWVRLVVFKMTIHEHVTKFIVLKYMLLSLFKIVDVACLCK
jgi:hypothetical protein